MAEPGVVTASTHDRQSWIVRMSPVLALLLTSSVMMVLGYALKPPVRIFLIGMTVLPVIAHVAVYIGIVR